MNYSIKLGLLLLAFAALWTAGCGNEAPAPAPKHSAMEGQAASAMAAEPARYQNQAAPASQDETAAPIQLAAAVPAGRKILYEADLTLVTPKLEPLEQGLRKLIRGSGGFVAQHSVSGDVNSPRTATWVLRVPVSRFDTTMEGLKGLGEVQSVEVGSQDVTEEYVDLTARIRNKRHEENRLLRHLERNTPRLQDILAIERELSRVRGEVEQMEGRLRYLTDRTDYTTITVTVREVAGFRPEQRTGFGDRIARTFGSSVESISSVGQEIVLSVVSAAPWVLVLMLFVLPAAGWWRRRG